LLVDSLNRCFRAPVVTGQKGGEHGGGATLTKVGYDVVRHYRAAESAAVKAGATHIRALSAEVAEPTTAADVLKPRRLNLD
jgi:molybdate transport system regulatory protein